MWEQGLWAIDTNICSIVSWVGAWGMYRCIYICIYTWAFIYGLLKSVPLPYSPFLSTSLLTFYQHIKEDISGRPLFSVDATLR